MNQMSELSSVSDSLIASGFCRRTRADSGDSKTERTVPPPSLPRPALSCFAPGTYSVISAAETAGRLAAAYTMAVRRRTR